MYGKSNCAATVDRKLPGPSRRVGPPEVQPAAAGTERGDAGLRRLYSYTAGFGVDQIRAFRMSPREKPTVLQTASVTP